MLMECGAWLRQQRETRGWARREMGRRLIQAGREAGDTSLPGIGDMCQNIRRWEHGEVKPGERYRLYYCTAFGIPPGQFGTAPAGPARPVPAHASPALPASVVVAYRGEDASNLDAFTVEREVLMTAHESGDHAQQAGQPGLGETTIEQLRADVVRLAALADTGETLAVFLDMRRVRDRIHRLLAQHLWPREQTDLYFLLGCLNGLMGNAANRLGYPDAAEELNRAGWAYANAIDHRPLMAWSRGQLSVIAYYRGRFEEARELALNGIEYLSTGPHAASLHIYHARAEGRIGDAGAVRQAVRDAHEARASDYDNDELLELGGNFVISEATHYWLVGSALATAAGAEREAAEALEGAIGLYEEGPRTGELHWFAGKPLAGIDLAVVRLRSGALDAAAEAVQPALSLSAAQRISEVANRLAVVRGELGAPIFSGSPQARDLGGQIEEFVRESVVAGLHSLPGGPG